MTFFWRLLMISQLWTHKSDDSSIDSHISWDPKKKKKKIIVSQSSTKAVWSKNLKPKISWCLWRIVWILLHTLTMCVCVSVKWVAGKRYSNLSMTTLETNNKSQLEFFLNELRQLNSFNKIINFNQQIEKLWSRLIKIVVHSFKQNFNN